MEIKIGNLIIGDKQPAFIIAELSANHNQSFELAVSSIKAMKEAGADAVKLQTYTADTITIDCNNKFFQIKQGTIWDGRNLYQLYKEAYTPWEWQPKLKKIAEEIGLVFFSTPFDKTAVDFLSKMDVPAYKIASPEILDIPLIEYIAAKGKPIFISTGIARFEDIHEAVLACRKKGNDQIILLKCTTAYPTPFEEVNLKVLLDLKKKFKTVVGISDHTLGISVPLVSLPFGAKVIEKHFIIDRKTGGPDASFSLDFAQFKQMVQSVRQAEKAIGRITYKLTQKMKGERELARSIFAVKNIKKGEFITQENVRSIRPGFGLHPKYLNKIIGYKATRSIIFGTPLSWKLITK